MAMDRIVVNVEELRTAIAQFERCKSELANAYGAMASEVLSLSSSWKSPASQAFVAQFADLQNNIKTSDGTIEQAVNGLKTAAEVYEEVLDETGAMFENMTDASPFQG